MCRELALGNKRSHRGEAQALQLEGPTLHNWRNPTCSNEDPGTAKKKKKTLSSSPVSDAFNKAGDGKEHKSLGGQHAADP